MQQTPGPNVTPSSAAPAMAAWSADASSRVGQAGRIRGRPGAVAITSLETIIEPTSDRGGTELRLSRCFGGGALLGGVNIAVGAEASLLTTLGGRVVGVVEPVARFGLVELKGELA
jgi:hypothetical protein